MFYCAGPGVLDALLLFCGNLLLGVFMGLSGWYLLRDLSHGKILDIGKTGILPQLLVCSGGIGAACACHSALL